MTRTTAVRARRVAALALSLGLALGATACSDDTDATATSEPSASEAPSEEPTPTEEPTEEPTDEALQITFDGDTVNPNGDRVEATAGEELTLAITADAPGELHVHATPEQVLPYKAGTSRLTLTIDTPGVVEVESHELGLIVVQLEVR